MDIRPDYAKLEGTREEAEETDPDEVPIGSVIVVNPGRRCPLTAWSWKRESVP